MKLQEIINKYLTTSYTDESKLNKSTIHVKICLLMISKLKCYDIKLLCSFSPVCTTLNHGAIVLCFLTFLMLLLLKNSNYNSYFSKLHNVSTPTKFPHRWLA